MEGDALAALFAETLLLPNALRDRRAENALPQVPTGDMPRHLLLNASRFLVDEATAGDRLIISGVLTTEMNQSAQAVAADKYGGF